MKTGYVQCKPNECTHLIINGEVYEVDAHKTDDKGIPYLQVTIFGDELQPDYSTLPLLGWIPVQEGERMTAKDLMVGDVVNMDYHDSCIIKGFFREKGHDRVTTSRWTLYADTLSQMIKTIHRPQPDGSMKQIYPEVE